jgi:hypothetical protein
VEKRRPITEEDLLMTELLISRSFGQMKQSVVQAPSRALRSAGGTLRKNPYAAAGAAVGAGIILYALFRLMTRKGAVKGSGLLGREQKSRPDMTMEIFSMILPLFKPYITGYLERYVGRMFSKDRH